MLIYIPAFILFGFKKKKIHAHASAAYIVIMLFHVGKCPCILEDCWISGRSISDCLIV